MAGRFHAINVWLGADQSATATWGNRTGFYEYSKTLRHVRDAPSTW